MGTENNLPIAAITLIVENVQSSVSFYRDKIGLRLVEADDEHGELASPIISLSLLAATAVKRRLGVEAGAVDGGIRKLMIPCRLENTTEVDAWYETLKRRGVGFLSPPKPHEWNAYAAYFSDPDGNLWELFTWQSGGAPENIRPERA